MNPNIIDKLMVILMITANCYSQGIKSRGFKSIDDGKVKFIDQNVFLEHKDFNVNHGYNKIGEYYNLSSTSNREGSKISFNLVTSNLKTLKSTCYIFDTNVGRLVKKIEGSTISFLPEAVIEQVNNPKSDPLSRTDDIYFQLDEKTLERKKKLTIPKGQVFTGFFGQKYITTYEKSKKNKKGEIPSWTTHLWDIANSKLKLLHSMKGAGSYNNGVILTSDFIQSKLQYYNINTDEKRVIDLRHKPSLSLYTKNMIIYSYNDWSASENGVSLYDCESGREKTLISNRDQKGLLYIDITNDGNYLFIVNAFENSYSLWNLNDVSRIAFGRLTHDLKSNKGVNSKMSLLPFKIKGGEFFLIPHGNTFSIFSVTQKKVIAQGYIDVEGDWALIACDGRVDGTKKAFDKIQLWEVKDEKLRSKTSLNSMFNKYYTPKLLYNIFNEDIETNTQFQDLLVLKPSIEIIEGAKIRTNQKIIKLALSANDNGDPIDKIVCYVNNKLYKAITSKNWKKTIVDLELIEGNNNVEFRAVSKKGYESNGAKISVICESNKIVKPNMYLISIGINQYKNSMYNLNYAKNDALSFVKTLENSSNRIFDKIFVTTLCNQEANNSAIIESLKSVKSKAKANDVFVFYYAGHGVMSIENNVSDSKYYLIPHNVTKMYSNCEELSKEAISFELIKEFFTEIKAQKQLIVLDACQSGGAINSFSKRGIEEEKAIAQLARSTGVYVLAASNTDQYASESSEIQHGLFTYSILESLKGNCNAQNGSVTVSMLKSCVEKLVPELTKKYQGESQYPTGYGFGQDFPLVIVDNSNVLK